MKLMSFLSMNIQAGMTIRQNDTLIIFVTRAMLMSVHQIRTMTDSAIGPRVFQIFA